VKTLVSHHTSVTFTTHTGLEYTLAGNALAWGAKASTVIDRAIGEFEDSIVIGSSFLYGQRGEDRIGSLRSRVCADDLLVGVWMEDSGVGMDGLAVYGELVALDVDGHRWTREMRDCAFTNGVPTLTLGIPKRREEEEKKTASHRLKKVSTQTEALGAIP
jgi:hypothetical protein